MPSEPVTISHDGFARQSLVRRVVATAHWSIPITCSWCGSRRVIGKRRSDRLFEYGTQPDDNGRINWHNGLFCSKSCHDSYHS